MGPVWAEKPGLKVITYHCSGLLLIYIELQAFMHVPPVFLMASGD